MDSARIGVDIVEVDRIERALQRTPSFAQKMFTDEERAYCESMARPAVHYAARFAAREAVLKALGTGFGRGMGRKDVSVSRDQHGRPFAVLSGRAAEVAKSLGIVEVALSLSHTADLAVANAMAITEQDRPQPKTAPDDERAQIARSFKEARSVLDELERVQDIELAAVEGNAFDSNSGGTDETASEY